MVSGYFPSELGRAGNMGNGASRQSPPRPAQFQRTFSTGRCIVDSAMGARAAKPLKPLSDGDYAALADLRYELRCFHHFSEQAARRAGLAPRQHQALLSIRGAEGAAQTVGNLARRLLIRPHSASELASRLEDQGLLKRMAGSDRRFVTLSLTEKAEDLLATLSREHLAELKRIQPLLGTLVERLEPEASAS